MVCHCSVDVGRLSYWLALPNFPNQNSDHTAACCYSSIHHVHVEKSLEQNNAEDFRAELMKASTAIARLYLHCGQGEMP